MRSDESGDWLFERLAALPTGTPDAARSDRVRRRCHAALTRRRESLRRTAPPPTRRQILELAIVWGFCLVYLSAVIRDAL